MKATESFIDEVVVEVAGGRGGDGSAHFRRERFNPRGGPDGGDGGNGGDVWLVADRNVSSLIAFKDHPHRRAVNGVHGKGKDQHGKRGEPLEVHVPEGTVAYDMYTGELLADLANHGDRWLAAHGGRGGRGNAKFWSNKRRAPSFAEQGEHGEERWLRLELKLMADVALVGFPNVGKSTLISVISAAKPKIANYPFTTLEPNLGVVRVDEDTDFVVADIPGLIEGASEGKGLGHEFLRHLERTKVVVYVIDPFAPDEKPVLDAYETLENELRSFSERLANKRHLVVLTKADIAPEDFDWLAVEAPLRKLGLEVLRLSAVSRDGIHDFKRRVWHLVQEEKEKVEVVEAKVNPKQAEDEGYVWMSRANEDHDFGI